MGALTGSISTSAYYVDGDIPQGFKERFAEGLRKQAFREIDLGLEHDESMGWVNIDDAFDTAFEVDAFLWNRYVLVGFRIDAVRLPASIVKIHYQRELGDYLENQGKERASKAERDNVKDHLVNSLRRKVLPTIKIIDMAWNLDRGEVWFFSGNKRLNDIFMDRFTETFGVSLIPRNPYSLLERMELDASMIDKAVRLDPTVFAVPPVTD